jgi:intein/homing endonuclease
MKFAEMLMEDYRDTALLAPRVHGWIIAPQMSLTDQNWRYFMRFFPNEWIVKPDMNERKIYTINDGLVEFKSTSNPSSLVSVGLDILLWTEIDQSEQPDKMIEAWANLFTRLQSPGRGPGGKGGLFLGNSCVVGDTLIATGDGIREIQQISDIRTPKTYVPTKTKLAGFAGEPQETEHFYVNGESETRKITSRAGYVLEGTSNHPIWVMGDDGNPCWRQLDELKVDDWVAIRRGANLWGNDCDLSGFECRVRPGRYHGPRFDHSQMTPDLAYLMGAILGDGYADAKQVIVTHSEKEQQTIDFLLSKPCNLNFHRSSPKHTKACNKEFSAFLKWYGFDYKKAREKTVPHRLFSAPKWVVANFLSGLFDTDGHARSDSGLVGFTSSSKRLVEQVQFLLLNFGIVSRLRSHVAKPNDRVRRSYSCIYTLEIPPKDSRIFFNEIGFRLNRKQSMSANIYTADDCQADRHDGVPKQQERMRRILKGTWFKTPSKPRIQCLVNQQWIGYPKLEEVFEVCACTDAKSDLEALKRLHDEHYFWDRIKSIETGYAETFDFVIPTTHAFVSNGFISHNTRQAVPLCINSTWTPKMTRRIGKSFTSRQWTLRI